MPTSTTGPNWLTNLISTTLNILETGIEIKLQTIMGLLSFGFGVCTGYYFRTTDFGIKLGKKILATSKLLKNNILTEYKLVLVVRDDLNMGRGKIASQCAHASVLAYSNASASDPEIATVWEAFGQGKVVLRVTSEPKLLELSDQAKKLGLFTNIVCDAGRTQVASGTKTVLAIGPGPKDLIDKVTANLRLL